MGCCTEATQPESCREGSTGDHPLPLQARFQQTRTDTLQGSRKVSHMLPQGGGRVLPPVLSLCLIRARVADDRAQWEVMTKRQCSVSPCFLHLAPPAPLWRCCEEAARPLVPKRRETVLHKSFMLHVKTLRAHEHERWTCRRRNCAEEEEQSGLFAPRCIHADDHHEVGRHGALIRRVLGREKGPITLDRFPSSSRSVCSIAVAALVVRCALSLCT